MNPDLWNGRRVLVTGHTRFKGSWLTAWLESLGARVSGLSLAAESGSMYEAVGEWEHESFIADLRTADLRAVLELAAPEVAFHLAAQPIVITGYEDPEGTFATNVMGTVRLLDALRDAPDLRCVVIVTSDKVYGSAPTRHRESDPLAGSDPYSASKVAQETVTSCFRESYFADGAGVVAARAGNVIGGGDHGDHRLIPDCVRAVRSGGRLELRNPGATRPWQHVLEPLRGYLTYAEYAAGWHESTPPAALNFGPTADDIATVNDVVTSFLAAIPGGDAVQVDADEGGSPPETAHLSIDVTAAGEMIGWRPALDLAAAIDMTAAWYGSAIAGDDMRALTLDQIATYQERTA